MNEYCGTVKNYNRLTHCKNVTDQCIESSRPIVWCRQFFWCVPHMTRYRDIGHVKTPGLLSANNGTTKIQWQGHVQDEVYLGQCGQFFVGKV